MYVQAERLKDLPEFARNRVNLASLGLGARAISVSDEFFAPLVRMLQDEPAVSIEGKFDTYGKWMDGQETRRRRDGWHDSAIIALGARGIIDSALVDNCHVKGNFPDGGISRLRLFGHVG